MNTSVKLERFVKAITEEKAVKVCVIDSPEGDYLELDNTYVLKCTGEDHFEFRMKIN